MTPNEALVKGGRKEKVTRGRISQADKDWISERVAVDGWKVDGYSVVQSSDATAPVEVEHKKTSTEKVVAEAYIRYPMGKWKALTVEGNKEVTMRAACFNCGYSLTGHLCDDPLVLVTGLDGYHVVKVVPV